MTTGTNDIRSLYGEFEEALTDVLLENEVGLARRSRLFKARTRLQAHPDFNDSDYRKAVDRAFERFALLKPVN